MSQCKVSSFKLKHSIFHTSVPRDTNTKTHLLLVLICFISTFSIIIYFAEFRSPAHPITAQQTLSDTANTMGDQSSQ